MKLAELLDTTGTFYWDFRQTFFIETKFGSFLWKDPKRQGNNTFTLFKGDHDAFLKKKGPIFKDREEGPQNIGKFCGDQIKVVGLKLED